LIVIPFLNYYQNRLRKWRFYAAIAKRTTFLFSLNKKEKHYIFEFFMLIDSHCHLNFPDFSADLDDVVADARSQGVKILQTICTEIEEFEQVLQIAEKYENIYCSVGVHPNNCEKSQRADLQYLLEKASNIKVIGIGETGLDYHYQDSQISIQQESFRIHIEAARISGLPIIIHTRDADEDTINILEQEMKKGAFKGLIHCFTSSEYLAQKSIEMGLYISLSGILTFKTAQNIRDTVKNLPIERLLIETDSPYLAPLPHRGKRNQPAYVKYVNQRLAEIKDLSEEQVANITSENFFRLFDKVAKC